MKTLGFLITFGGAVAVTLVFFFDRFETVSHAQASYSAIDQVNKFQDTKIEAVEKKTNTNLFVTCRVAYHSLPKDDPGYIRCLQETP